MLLSQPHHGMINSRSRKRFMVLKHYFIEVFVCEDALPRYASIIEVSKSVLDHLLYLLFF